MTSFLSSEQHNTAENSPQNIQQFEIAIKKLMLKKGGNWHKGFGIFAETDLSLGWEDNDDEDSGHSVSFPKVVGKMSYKTVESNFSHTTDLDTGKDIVRSTLRHIREFNFYQDLKTDFSTIINLLPAPIYHRILRSHDTLNILLYDFDTKMMAEFLAQNQVLDQKIVPFTQGELVIVAEDDKILASCGRSLEGCRYYLVTDPIRKIASATHLDYPYDEECLREMVDALLRHGSRYEDLKIHASPHSHPGLNQKIARLFPQTTFDLTEPDFQYDIHKDIISVPSKDDVKELLSGDSISERESLLLNIRREYGIGHVLRYHSPHLQLT